ncbi:hypothetical protein BDV38DRAFT_285919 [Aspergillus pseudotamarii]|uniref:Uncharacterized protein n=1 Tax=Aspergillus pseudotamarii TaxID=132259 RepID=A0A5N6SMT7_ASPPS|nr:uncharacterized protein BDV38DRAFT_285919 [Aspergillus pseudotamarii]KAE8134454.1 hypothetical protein BDV38DRAFT_285919 [Aspergillus pseudotamarii]
MPYWTRVRSLSSFGINSVTLGTRERYTMSQFLRECLSLAKRGELEINQYCIDEDEYDNEIRLEDWAEAWGKPTLEYASVCMRKKLLEEIASYECTTRSPP